jgi:hypothetical protein
VDLSLDDALDVVKLLAGIGIGGKRRCPASGLACVHRSIRICKAVGFCSRDQFDRFDQYARRPAAGALHWSSRVHTRVNDTPGTTATGGCKVALALGGLPEVIG